MRNRFSRRDFLTAPARTVGKLDTVLAVVAMVIGILAAVSVLSLLFGPWALN